MLIVVISLPSKPALSRTRSQPVEVSRTVIVPLTLALLVDPDARGVADARPLGVADALADPDGEAEAEPLGVAEPLAVGEAEPDALGDAATSGVGVGSVALSDFSLASTIILWSLTPLILIARDLYPSLVRIISCSPSVIF